MSDIMGKSGLQARVGLSERDCQEAEGKQIQRQQDRGQDANLTKGPHPGIGCGTWEVLGNWGWEPLRVQSLSQISTFLEVIDSVYFQFSGT